MHEAYTLHRGLEIPARGVMISLLGASAGLLPQLWWMLPFMGCWLLFHPISPIDERRQSAEYLLARGVRGSALARADWAIYGWLVALGVGWWLVGRNTFGWEAEGMLAWLASAPHQVVLLGSFVALTMLGRARSYQLGSAWRDIPLSLGAMLGALGGNVGLAAVSVQVLGLPSWFLPLPAAVLLVAWCYRRTRDALYDFDRLQPEPERDGTLPIREASEWAVPARRGNAPWSHIVRIVRADLQQIARDRITLPLIVMHVVFCGWCLATIGLPGSIAQLYIFPIFAASVGSTAGAAWTGPTDLGGSRRAPGAKLGFLLGRPVSRAQVFGAHVLVFVILFSGVMAFAASLAVALRLASPQHFGLPSARVFLVACALGLLGAAPAGIPVPKWALGVVRGRQALVSLAPQLAFFSTFFGLFMYATGQPQDVQRAMLSWLVDRAGLVVGLALGVLAAFVALGWRDARRIEI